MKQMELFEPAMCCESGTCGPSVDPELLRIKGILGVLHDNGIIVKRHNLSKDPQSFLQNADIQNLMNQNGVGILPITVLDGQAVLTYGYPSDHDFVELLDLKGSLADQIMAFKEKQCCCCGGDDSSCHCQ